MTRGSIVAIAIVYGLFAIMLTLVSDIKIKWEPEKDIVRFMNQLAAGIHR